MVYLQHLRCCLQQGSIDAAPLSETIATPEPAASSHQTSSKLRHKGAQATSLWRPLSATAKVRPPYSLSPGPWPTDLVQAESLPHSHEDVNHVPKVRLDLPSLREDMSSINVKFNYSPENRGTGAH